jgi:hypothetical protein
MAQQQREAAKTWDAARVGGAAIGLLALILVVLTAMNPIKPSGVDFAILLGVAAAGFLLPNLRGFTVSSRELKIDLSDQVEKAKVAAEDGRDASQELAKQIEQRLATLDEKVSRLLAASEREGANTPRTVRKAGGGESLKLPAPKVANDPQKGRFGGAPKNNGRILSASVTPSKLRPGWCTVHLRVRPDRGAPPVTQPVRFYVHDTFQPNEFIVHPVDGKADLELIAWGAFTTGAVVDDPASPTLLELDLADRSLVDAPADWRDR